MSTPENVPGRELTITRSDKGEWKDLRRGMDGDTPMYGSHSKDDHSLNTEQSGRKKGRVSLRARKGQVGPE